MTYWGEYKDTKDVQNLDFIEKIVNAVAPNREASLQPPALKKFKHEEPKSVHPDHFRFDRVSLNNVEHMKYSIMASQHLSELGKNKMGEQMARPPRLSVEFSKSFLSSIDRISQLLDSYFSTGRFQSFNSSDDNNNNNNNNNNNKNNSNNSNNNNKISFLDVSEVHASCIRKLIRKSIAIICINAGFTECEEACLDTLCGVFGHFMTSLCSKLSAYASPCNPLQMPEFVAKVFLESGLGHPDELIGWYGAHVVGLNRRLSNQNEALYEKCLKKQKEIENS